MSGPKVVTARSARRKRGRTVRLRDDILDSLPNAGLALSVTATLFWWFYGMAVRGTSSTVEVMPFMDDPDAYAAYWLSQAFGWAALIWAWAALVLGLLLAGKTPSWLARQRKLVEASHRRLGLTVIALTLGHALALLFDPHNTSLAEVLVPGAYGHEPGRFAVGLGIVALYLMIPLTLSFYFRERIGQRTWRILHRFVIVVYALGVWHALLWGTNVWFTGWARTLLWLAQIPLALLLIHRVVTPARASERAPTRQKGLTTRAEWMHLGHVLLRTLLVASLLLLVASAFWNGGRPHD